MHGRQHGRALRVLAVVAGCQLVPGRPARWHLNSAPPSATFAPRLARAATGAPDPALAAGLHEWRAYLSAVYKERVSAARVPDLVQELEWLYRCTPGLMPEGLAEFRFWNKSRNTTASPLNISCAHALPNAPTDVVPFAVSIVDSLADGVAYVGKPNSDGLALHSAHGVFVHRSARPRAPVPNGSWVEVMRVHTAREPWHGTIFFYALRGTGIWINVGRTCVFKPRAGLGASLEEQAQWPKRVAQREAIWNASASGCNSVQFPGVWGVRMHEIAVLRAAEGEQAGACGSGIPKRTGVCAQLECKCSEAAEVLNCGPWPAAALGSKSSAPPGSRPSPEAAASAHAYRGGVVGAAAAVANCSSSP